MLPQEIIRRKRDGAPLPDEDILAFVNGIAGGAVNEAQMAAMAMAIVLKGLDGGETVSLTRAMAGSGTVLDWSGENLDGPVLDKHSTGGVGDKVSLILAPIVAACGGFVPMISGRGLGHTGGTLDKLAAVPGYRTEPDLDLFRCVVKATGCAIIGATPDLAPADRRLYAVRDITATVESIALITASILSKKLAAGLDGLVMDVKFGSGAFLPGRAEADALADSIVRVGRDCGLRIAALLTDMNQVLGHTAGNALEVRESIDILRDGRGDARLVDVTLSLAAEILDLGGLAPSPETGRMAARRALESGAAAERFSRMVAALGGPANLIDAPGRHLAAAPVTMAVEAREPGTVTAIDVRRVGLAIVSLGGGRTRTDQAIDPAVGLSAVAGLGDRVGPGERVLALVHARDEADGARAAEAIRAAFTIEPQAEFHPKPPIAARLAPDRIGP
jgi:thymidine phosphorylase